MSQSEQPMFAETLANPVKQRSGASMADVAESALPVEPASDTPTTRSWVFKPNCSLTPRQLAGLYLSLVCVTLGIAAGFCLFGLWVVLPFAGIELLLVGIAFLVYARHAGDYEHISLQGRELCVNVMRASRLSSVSFNPGWTRVDLTGPGRLLKLESGQAEVSIGRYLPVPQRERLVYELRRALAAAAA